MNLNNKQLIILDRDGVINEDSDDYVKSPDEWQPIPGSLEAIKKLNDAGKIVVVATNQSGVGRGLFSQSTLDAMHDKLHHLLRGLGAQVDHIFSCIHTPENNCGCRKPKPGMILAAMEKFNAPLNKTIVVGDSKRDLEAAHAAGCESVLVKTGKGIRTLAKSDIESPVFENLMTFVDALLESEAR
jgi:D-glycero-D-manno-heptose 1,7-bisphosphate phosphatase